MGLPCVNHFVNNGLKDLDQWHDGEVRRIDCDLIGRSLVDGVNEAPAREIAICPLFPLHRDQAARQFSPKQRPVVMIKRELQLSIGLSCRVVRSEPKALRRRDFVLHKTIMHERSGRQWGYGSCLSGTREKLTRGNCIVVCSGDATAVQILRVSHAAQQRPSNAGLPAPTLFVAEDYVPVLVAWGTTLKPFGT